MAETIAIARDGDIIEARRCAKQLAGELHFDTVSRVELVTAVSEIARNILVHAGRGIVKLEILAEGGKTGVVVEASDDGPGIEDIELAISDHYSTGVGLGLGLPGARRLTDAFDISSSPSGTRIRMTKWRR